MTDPLLRDALRLIQDIVAEAKGAPLEREAIRRVAEVLQRLTAAHTTPVADTGYSRRAATILFADLRGFSAISAAYPPDVVLGVLSRCFGRMTEIVLRHYGTIDKFMGDAIMGAHRAGSGKRPGAIGRPIARGGRIMLCARLDARHGRSLARKEWMVEGYPEAHDSFPAPLARDCLRSAGGADRGDACRQSVPAGERAHPP